MNQNRFDKLVGKKVVQVDETCTNVLQLHLDDGTVVSINVEKRSLIREIVKTILDVILSSGAVGILLVLIGLYLVGINAGVAGLVALFLFILVLVYLE